MKHVHIQTITQILVREPTVKRAQGDAVPAGMGGSPYHRMARCCCCCYYYYYYYYYYY